jgi:hypothetical protein
MISVCALQEAEISIVLIVMAAAPAPAASQDPGTVITFYKDVLPVLQKNCQTPARPKAIRPLRRRRSNGLLAAGKSNQT